MILDIFKGLIFIGTLLSLGGILCIFKSQWSIKERILVGISSVILLVVMLAITLLIYDL